MKQAAVFFRNYGGLSPDMKEGPEFSFANSRHLDFRKNPTLASILPKMTKESGSIVTDLVTEGIILPSGKMVFIGDAGGVYTRATNGAWTKNGTTLPDTSAGMAYNLQHDTIYVPGTTSIHTITNADGRFSGGSFTVNAYAIGAHVDESAGNHTNTYTTPSAISEAATDKLTITPAVEPNYSVKLWVTTKGTGDLTVTMHDSANNKLGSKLVANASLVNGQLNEFVLNDIRMNVKPNASDYHYHITYDNSGGKTASTIGCATASDFSTADFEEYANRLVPVTYGWHPCIDFLQYICIGNGRYLAVWEVITDNPDNVELLQHRLVFPTGYEVIGLALWNEYLAIAVAKPSTTNTIEVQDGRVLLWDGTSTSPDSQIPIPEGAPYSLFHSKNMLEWIAGNKLFGWNGGEPQELFQMPNTDFEYTDQETYVTVNPHMMAVRNGILMLGYASLTNSALIEQGIYSYGSRMKNYPASFGYSYSPSTGSVTGSTLKIGMIKSIGDKLFMSWKDGSNYGVDVISPNVDPASDAKWESLIIDNGRPDKDKQADTIVIEFNTLPSGATVTPKYKLERGAWVTGSPAVAGSTEVRMNVGKRYKEIQIGYDLVATTATPEIKGVTFLYDDLVEERD